MASNTVILVLQLHTQRYLITPLQSSCARAVSVKVFEETKNHILCSSKVNQVAIGSLRNKADIDRPPLEENRALLVHERNFRLEIHSNKGARVDIL